MKKILLLTLGVIFLWTCGGGVGGTDAVYIGCDSGVNQDFYGEIASMSIWSKAFSSSDVADNRYGEWLGTETDLIAAWNFESNLLDATSNDTDLSITGSATYTDVP